MPTMTPEHSAAVPAGPPFAVATGTPAPLVLNGLDGGNPLAFLAALGALVAAARVVGTARMKWEQREGGWRPTLTGVAQDHAAFLDRLLIGLDLSREEPFNLDRRLPFAATTFRAALEHAAAGSAPEQRRQCDLMAAFGSEIHSDENGVFADTALRMVRSGDAAGQGLLAYAQAVRQSTDADALCRTLFAPWRYEDEGFSLRWDPQEDQRYALRWHDPAPQTNKKFNLRTMRGANCLALEALALLPVQPVTHGAATTGFSRLDRRRDFFTWPIWDAEIGVDLARSLLSLGELHRRHPSRAELTPRGIVEVYRCERIAPNQYYRNFSPARPA